MPAASIVIPTRERLPYLDVALASVVPQARAAGAEVVVVDDAGPSEAARDLCAAHGARYEPHPGPLGLNVARNTGIACTTGELVVFVDDDVRARPGWLAALLAAAREHPEAQVLAGRITVSLEGPAPRSCGRERAPLTSLDLGAQDGPARFAWGANMTIRRAALERFGPFDESIDGGGDEQEWQERMRAADPAAEVLYVAAAELEHRRAGEDAGLPRLCRASHARGRAARRFDAGRGVAPPLGAELQTLLGCLGHVVRRACPMGLTMAAHSAGRLREGLREAVLGNARPAGPPGAEDFLSGASGNIGGRTGILRAAADIAIDARERAGGQRARVHRAAAGAPPRRVLAIGVVRPEHAERAGEVAAELRRSRHEVELQTRAPGGLGKFENLNLLLAEHPPAGNDWLLVVDDDIVLPRGFLDSFVFLCERFALDLAQPAHRLRSHAAWAVTRRHPGSLVRESSFVEIGPLTAFAASTFDVLLPFPPLRMGWGLDVHWAAIARERGWRCGIVDAVPISHAAAPAAAAYDRERAVSEAREFLASRPYVPAREAERTLATHRSL